MNTVVIFTADHDGPERHWFSKCLAVQPSRRSRAGDRGRGADPGQRWKHLRHDSGRRFRRRRHDIRAAAWTYPPLPNIRLFQPSSAAPGATIRLTGNYLLGLTGVSFNGTLASFTPINVNYAEAIVPARATKGPITVTTMNGSFTTKSSFNVE